VVLESPSANMNARSNAFVASWKFLFPQRAMPLEMQPINEGWMLMDYVTMKVSLSRWEHGGSLYLTWSAL
jgi:hypothetical protein